METDNVTVKIEPDSGGESSQDVKDSIPMEIGNVSCTENVKTEPMDELSSAPESITVKLEPTYYSSGDGQDPGATSTSQNNPSLSKLSTEKSIAQQPQSFQDLLNIWEKNEETEEVGFFFAYCRATSDCGGYDVDTDTSIDSEEELSSDSLEPESNNQSSKYFYGRNGFQWSKTPVPMYGKTDIIEVPSCTIPGEKNPYNIWNALIGDVNLEEILKWTNVKLAECRTQIQDPSLPHLAELDIIELKAFFGALLYSVFMRMHLRPPKEMFSEEDMFRVPLFHSLMNEYRFTSIFNCLSFGDPQSENETSDRNIAVLFERFVENCKEMYKGSGYAVIGETLVPFWGSNEDERFPMRYAERPCCDGFRLPCLFDVKTGFIHNMYIPYVDLDSRDFTKEEAKFSEQTKLALLLTKPLHGTNTNITCNKEYLSFELIDEFTKLGLTCMGTIEKSNKEIPREFLPSRKRKKGTALYGYSEDVTLLSYMNKNRKATILASSMLFEGEDEEQNVQRPKLLRIYNKNKVANMNISGEGDEDYIFDCYRRTALVPMALFYRLLDFSVHNAHIMCSLNSKKILSKFTIVKIIARQMCEGHLMRRAMDRTLSDQVRKDILKILGPEE